MVNGFGLQGAVSQLKINIIELTLDEMKGTLFFRKAVHCRLTQLEDVYIYVIILYDGCYKLVPFEKMESGIIQIRTFFGNM